MSLQVGLDNYVTYKIWTKIGYINFLTVILYIHIIRHINKLIFLADLKHEEVTWLCKLSLFIKANCFLL